MIEPNGCHWCGVLHQDHAQRWSSRPGVGWHKWSAPTDVQILDRMKARRRARLLPKEN